MKPKLEIIYSKSFTRALYDGFEFDEDWQDIMAKGQYFEKYLDRYEKNILRLIPKFTGVDWKKFKRSIIYIYIKHKEPGFLDPLTIPAKANPEIMLALLISKLVMLNLNFSAQSALGGLGGKVEKDEENKTFADIANSVTLQILESLGLNTDSFLKYLDLYYLHQYQKNFHLINFGRKKAKSLLG